MSFIQENVLILDLFGSEVWYHLFLYLVLSDTSLTVLSILVTRPSCICRETEVQRSKVTLA